MNPYTIRAYAKVNLGLDVVKRLENGYHQVKMIMQTVGIYDELSVWRTEGGIVLTTDAGELPTDENNLICKAVKLMTEKYGIREGVRIHLEKHIPIAAGMAGGSTDAAAAMKAVNDLFGLGLDEKELMEDGVKIGADVPYCILGGTALAEGIGEKLTVLPDVPDMYLVVAKPALAVSTKHVYEHLDAEGIGHHPDIDGMIAAIRVGSLRGVTVRMENVLEAVTIPEHPVIDTLKVRMRELGAVNSLMSGSGPTVFGVFETQAAAGRAYEQMRQENPETQIFLTTPV
jgi:4-diphosphocytidyl-2-C-methyl-D-erythritol kinase